MAEVNRTIKPETRLSVDINVIRDEYQSISRKLAEIVEKLEKLESARSQSFNANAVLLSEKIDALRIKKSEYTVDLNQVRYLLRLKYTPKEFMVITGLDY